MYGVVASFPNAIYAGAIQLSLSVAADSDKANRALSWIMDGRPAEVSNTLLLC